MVRLLGATDLISMGEITGLIGDIIDLTGVTEGLTRAMKDLVSGMTIQNRLTVRSHGFRCRGRRRQAQQRPRRRLLHLHCRQQGLRRVAAGMTGPNHGLQQHRSHRPRQQQRQWHRLHRQ
jgi:hypothetical protein